MAEPFDQLLAQATQSYRALLERSWTLLVARTPPDDAAAITAACDLQRQLITTGTAWLALMEQVRAFEQEATARLDAPQGATVGPPDLAPTPRRPPHHHQRSARRHQRVRVHVFRRPAASRLAATGPAVHDPSDALPITREPSAGERAPERAEGAAARDARRADAAVGGTTPAPAAAAGAPLPPTATPAAPTPPPIDQVPLPTVEPTPAGVAAPGRRVCPLVPGALPPRTRLTAMAFNGTVWQPVTVWRRLFQQVLQTLQSSDPPRFDQMAAELTLQNGRRLFNRSQGENLAPLAAGGTWYTTGQIPTALILQRLRRVVAWWELPLTALEVELAPFPVEETPDRDRADAIGAVEPSARPGAGLDEHPAASAAAPIGALEVAMEGPRSPRPRVEHALPEASAEAGSSEQPVEPAASRGEGSSAAGGRGSCPPARRSRIYSVDRGVRLLTTEGAREVPPEPGPGAVPGLGMPAPAPPVQAERPAGPVGAAEPAGDRPAAQGVPLPRQDAPAAGMPDAMDVPMARRAGNVRWVKTASGTSLPLRPPPSDE